MRMLSADCPPAAPEDPGSQESHSSHASKLLFLGLEVSGTGLELDDRERIKALINSGGGNYSGVFSRSTHVLVAAGVGSDKYQAAKDWGIPVVNPDWVVACVKEDCLVEKSNFLLKPFFGLQICVTGFQRRPAVRTELIQMIESNGGRYFGDMDRHERTHLVAESASGEKYKAALLWNAEAQKEQLGDHVIRVVTRGWIEDCIRQDRWLPETNYGNVPKEIPFTPPPSCMERTRKRQRDSADRLKQKRKDGIDRLEDERRREQEQLERDMEQESMTLQKLKNCGASLSVLEPYFIYLHGFDARRWRTAAFLVQCTGATVLWEWSSLVTHIVLGQKPNLEYLNELIAANPNLETIQMSVILECLHTQKNSLSLTNKRARSDAESSKENLNPRPNESPRGSAQPLQNHRLTLSTNENSVADFEKFFNTLGKGRSVLNLSRNLRLGRATDFSQTLICVSRYTDDERDRVRVLVEKLGATFTDRFTRHPRVTYLISKDKEGEKCIRAKQWKIPIHNLNWLENQVRLHKIAVENEAFSVST